MSSFFFLKCRRPLELDVDRRSYFSVLGKRVKRLPRNECALLVRLRPPAHWETEGRRGGSRAMIFLAEAATTKEKKNSTLTPHLQPRKNEKKTRRLLLRPRNLARPTAAGAARGRIAAVLAAALPRRGEEERSSKKPAPPEATSASASPSPPATPVSSSDAPPPPPSLPSSSPPPRRDQQQLPQNRHHQIHPTQRLPTPALRPPPHSPRRVSFSPAGGGGSGRDVVVESLSSCPLLRGLPPGLTRWFRPPNDDSPSSETDEEGNDLVLAFDAAGGETAMEDVPLGQVRRKSFFFLSTSSFFFLVFFVLFFPSPSLASYLPPLFPLKKTPRYSSKAHPRPLPRGGQGQALVDDARLGQPRLGAAARDAVPARRGQAGGPLRCLGAADRRVLQGHAEAREVSL